MRWFGQLLNILLRKKYQATAIMHQKLEIDVVPPICLVFDGVIKIIQIWEDHDIICYKCRIDVESDVGMDNDFAKASLKTNFLETPDVL